MQIEELHELFSWGVAYAALGGLFALGVYSLFGNTPLGRAGREALSNIWSRYRRLGAFGQIVIAVCFCNLYYYGSTKGFWNAVQHGGGDDILTVTGIYTGVSNDIQVVEGVTTTNQIPLVRVEWLGNGGTAETPVSIRPSETNEWMELVKIDPVVGLEGITNTLQFIAETNYSHFAYWWFGVDRPAIIVTEEGIEIREFIVTTRSVTFEWVCGEEGVQWYTIRKRKVGTSEWTNVATVPAVVGGVNRWTGEMFTVDTDYDWQIMTEIVTEVE